MESIDDALTYPMEDDDWTVTVLIGGGLSLLSFLIVPAILVYGYLVQAIRKRADGATQPPGFEDWGELLVDGVKAWLIGIEYMLFRSSCSYSVDVSCSRLRPGLVPERVPAWPASSVGWPSRSSCRWCSATLRSGYYPLAGPASSVPGSTSGRYGRSHASGVRDTEAGLDCPFIGVNVVVTCSTSFHSSARLLPCCSVRSPPSTCSSSRRTSGPAATSSTYEHVERCGTATVRRCSPAVDRDAVAREVVRLCLPGVVRISYLLDLDGESRLAGVDRTY